MGTNFTLACPYTLLAHYTELKWAASYGVESELVRISVGLEPVSTLKDVLASALNAAHHADDAGGNLEVVERLKRELAASQREAAELRVDRPRFPPSDGRDYSWLPVVVTALVCVGVGVVIGGRRAR